MEYAAYYDEPAEFAPEARGFVPSVSRPRFLPLPFLLPVLLCGISHFAGGIPAMTDFGFDALTVFCTIFFVMELIHFPVRFGIGGLLLFGGVLIWLCHDYFYYWHGVNFQTGTTAFPAWVVAKTAFWDCVFVFTMTVGLQIQWGRWMEKLIVFPPEPRSPQVYWYLVLGMFFFGISPYFLFTQEFGLWSMTRAAIGSWLGSSGVTWVGGRTGNLNYSYYAYIAQWLQVGELGSILAAAYAVFLATSTKRKVFCWAIWFYYFLVSVESTRRGSVAYTIMPVVAFYFIKHQAAAGELAKRFSLRAYVFAAVLLFIYLVVCQLLGSFRSRGLATFTLGELSHVDLAKSQGNSMFSEALPGFALVGESTPPFYDKFPGEGALRLIPDVASDFFIQIVPRAIWPDKPIDPVWAWYNVLVAGVSTDATGTGGTTISSGPAGHWYFRYGPAGVVEGGILVGWLMGATERAFRRSNGKLIALLTSLGVAVWLFRAYRDFIYIDLYPLIIGAVVFTVMVWVANLFTAAPVYAEPA